MDSQDDTENRHKKKTEDMVGPVYATGEQEKMAVNHFKEVVVHAEALRLMQGPIYDVDRNHHFEQLMVHAQELKNLEGPVYDIDRKHQFQELITHAYELKNLQGPVLLKDGTNKFVAPPPVNIAVPGLDRPVFKDVGGRNAYAPSAPSCPKPDPLFLGPRLPGVDPKNSYVETLVPVESEKLMVAPTYRGFDIEPQNNYMPDNPNKPHEPQMLGPKLPYIEENHKYGPVPPRNPPTDPMAGPIYPNIEFHNENNIVNERVHGQIVMAGPPFSLIP